MGARPQVWHISCCCCCSSSCCVLHSICVNVDSAWESLEHRCKLSFTSWSYICCLWCICGFWFKWVVWIPSTSLLQVSDYYSSQDSAQSCCRSSVLMATRGHGISNVAPAAEVKFMHKLINYWKKNASWVVSASINLWWCSMFCSVILQCVILDLQTCFSLS